MSDPGEVSRVQHDYSAVDEFVTHLGNRHRAQAANWNAQTWTHYAAWGALLIAALGVAAFFILWGVSLVIEKPEPMIIETERIIERPVSINPTIHVETTGPQGPLESIREEATARIGDLVTSDHGPATSGVGTETLQDAVPVYNYVIFRELDYQRGGALGVTVGMQYADSDSEKPAEQWCYIEFPTDDIGVVSTIQLSAVSNGIRSDLPVTNQMAREAGTSVSVLREAQMVCAFE
ncbi:MAG: hypothetical protein RIM33_02730 [Alphaproteobacteria bacterium]